MTMIKNDKTIRQDIVAHLAWDARINPVNIDVRVEDGAVQLVGTTATYSERIAAYEAAWTVPGVVSVDNRLLVTPPDNYDLPTDDDIRDNIDRILRVHPQIDSFNVDAVVNGGRVDLRGTVDAYWKKQRLEGLAGDIGGVIDIENNLSVKPEQAMPDDTIAEAIETALARTDPVDADKIDISVENGLVTLSGTVPNWNAYRAAYQAALYTSGVMGILDDLRIRDTS